MINTLEDLKNNIDNLSNAKILQYSLKFDYVDGFEKCLTYYKQKYNGFESGIISKCIKDKNYKIFKYLIDKQTNNSVYCFNYDLICIKYVNENKKIDINHNDDTLLRNAAFHGNYDVVKYLIDNGANVHVNNEYALRTSTIHGYYKIVKLLIDNNAVTNDTEYFITSSCKFNRINILKYFIKLGITDYLNEGLQKAIQFNNLTIIKYLIKYGIKLELGHIISTLSYTNIITFKYIMNSYINDNYDVMNYLNNLLETSVIYCHYDKIEYLLNIGADVEILNDYDDDIIFDIVLKYNRMKKISKILK